ncbi:hypothetical protein DRE_00326 [Drechslerella stenobrocha 248]|uniref:GRAM domain-containing protein n=1 Tax=Drechslerella stenobrocha 248 TaxID=1043628 RepID=W7I5A0_9PEZI|nr:hypothetical protein DRE_00326 [Drechslerella stenobrocha 248]
MDTNQYRGPMVIDTTDIPRLAPNLPPSLAGSPDEEFNSPAKMAASEPPDSPMPTTAPTTPLKLRKPSISKSITPKHSPKRIRAPLLTVTARGMPPHHILDTDVSPFRLTRDDFELIKQCNRERFQQNGKVISEHEQKLRELKIARRKMLVNYTADRHLTCAAVVQAPVRAWPLWQDTVRKEGYLSWAGKMALYLSQGFAPAYTSPWMEVPKYESETTLSHLERVAVGVAPWWEWARVVRGVYRWEKPLRTVRWMVVYAVLWWYQFLVTFMYVYLIARVLRNRQDRNEAEKVKASIVGARRQLRSVQRLEGRIERRKSDDWVEVLPKDVGSKVQLGLGDLADLLEIIQNFYEWRRPAQTVNTLVLLGVCLLFSLCTDMAYCWRLITFIFGLWFFVSSPVASLWPRYRWVVSPLRWAFWGIPTHADIAYSEFREDAVNAIKDPTKKKKAARRRAWRKRMADYEGPLTALDGDGNEAEDEGYITNSPNMEEDEEDDPEELVSPNTAHRVQTSQVGLAKTMVFCGFRCVYQRQLGRLFVSDFGLLFETEATKKLMVEMPWRYIKAIRKRENISSTGGEPVHALDVTLMGEEVVSFEGMNSRDKAFKRIIGFSGLQWQSGA